MQQVTKEERSAGGVVYRKIEGKYEFLLGKHSGYHKWVLPKGLIESGETQMEAAVREVGEEVGVEAQIVDLTPVKVIEYWYFADPDESGDTTRRVKKYQEDPDFTKVPSRQRVRIHKQVTYYLMELVSDSGAPGWEMEDRAWVGYEEGKQLLTFPTELEVFTEAGKILKLGAPAEI